MAKTVKTRRRKIGKFRYKANRKTKKYQSGTVDKIFKTVKLETKKDDWDKNKSTKFNCEKLGIVHNLNKAMKPQTFKEDAHEEDLKNKKSKKETSFVKQLIAESRKKKVDSNLRMPPRTVEYITYLLDNYGEDYKAMALDGRNYDQETWKQMRSKINKFKSCTDQYAQYLKRRNLLNDS